MPRRPKVRVHHPEHPQRASARRGELRHPHGVHGARRVARPRHCHGPRTVHAAHRPPAASAGRRVHTSAAPRPGWRNAENTAAWKLMERLGLRREGGKARLDRLGGRDDLLGP